LEENWTEKGYAEEDCERRLEEKLAYQKYVKSTCSRLGWALTALLLISMGVGLIFNYFELDAVPEPVVTILGYLAAAPSVFLLLREVPAVKQERKKMRFRKFLMFFVLVQGFGYIFNIAGNLLNAAVAAGMGRNPLNMNPVNDMLARLDWLMILYIAVLGPLVEEYIFRWVLLNRLRPFGEKAAILFSALMFGLLHGNLTQFLYATAIGIIFGYVAVKTGRMVYNCLLHILVNSGSTLLALSLQGSVFWQMVLSAGTALAMVGYIAAALVIFCLKVRKTRLAPGAWPDGVEYRDFAAAMYLNPGVLSFVILSLIMMGLYLFVV